MKPKSILNKHQIALLKEIKNDDYLSSHFYLAWGTTLAEYYLHHRLSDDLDFFTKDTEIDVSYIEKFFENKKEVLWIKSWQRIKKYDRNMIHLIYNDGFELKTEFTIYFQPLYPLETKNWLQIESINDIFLNKIACIVDRHDPKDYIDLFYLWDEPTVDLINITRRYEEKFKNSLSNSTLWYAFFKGKKINTLPHLIDKKFKRDRFHLFFSILSKEYGYNSIYSSSNNRSL